MHSLEPWGWTGEFAARFDALAPSGTAPARVLAVHRDLYMLITAAGELQARVSGRFRYVHARPEEAPAVGDWVVAELPPGSGPAVIHAVLPRGTQVVRKEAGERGRAQVLAANVDTIWLVTSANQEFNARRLERFLAIAWESGAVPVVVLNKADLCDDLDTWQARAAAVAPGLAVHTVSALRGDGTEALEPYCRPGRTIVMLGSSGVGKSTLANRLAGRDVLAVSAIREDDARGRHTTSHRELLPLARGGMIIDTPGLREVGLWLADEGMGETFADIESFARQCRFRDCRHESEPGCAVREALARGAVDEGREQSYRKLRRELEHLERKEDRFLRDKEKRRWKAITKQMRTYDRTRGR